MLGAANIAKLQARIAFVDARENISRVVISALRNIGFRETVHYSSLDDLTKSKEHLNLDWIIISTQDITPNAIMGFMRYIYEKPHLRHIRFSLFLADRHYPILPNLFELGILSWHPMDFNHQTLTAELKSVVQKSRDYNHYDALVAGHFLRRYLKQARFYQELLNLENCLNHLFPKQTELGLFLAEAFFLAGSVEKGKAVLNEVQKDDPSANARVADIYERFVGRSQSAKNRFATNNKLENVVIIDSDKQSVNVVKAGLTHMGVPHQRAFRNGLEAWEYLKRNGEPHLIVTEWQGPDLNAAQLLQRVRDQGWVNVPIIVMSGRMERADNQLMKELHVAQFMLKPLREKQLLMTLAYTISQHQTPTEAKMVERKIEKYLASGEMREAGQLAQRFKGMGRVSDARKFYIDGLCAYYEGRYMESMTSLKDSIETMEGDNVEVISALSRSLLQLGDSNAALALLERAAVLSPKNISRLCELAEINIGLKRFAAAKNLLGSAAALDRDHEGFKQTACRYAIASGDMAGVRDWIAKVESIDALLSYTNNLAIQRSKEGAVHESIRLYETLLRILPDDKVEHRAVVLFNLGLGHVKANQMEAARKVLEEAVEYTDARIYPKAESLLHRVSLNLKSKAIHVLHEQIEDAMENTFSLVGSAYDGSGVKVLRATIEGQSAIALQNVYRPLPKDRKAS